MNVEDDRVVSGCITNDVGEKERSFSARFWRGVVHYTSTSTSSVSDDTDHSRIDDSAGEKR